MYKINYFPGIIKVANLRDMGVNVSALQGVGISDQNERLSCLCCWSCSNVIKRF